MTCFFRVQVETWTEGVSLVPSFVAWVFPAESVLFTKSFAPVPTAAHAFIDAFHWLRRELPSVEAPTIVHDWRSFTKVPADARRVFASRRRELEGAPRRIVIALSVNPIVRMAIRTVTLTAQLLAHAAPVDLVDHPELSLRELGVVAPDAALHARLRLAWQSTGHIGHIAR